MWWLLIPVSSPFFFHISLQVYVYKTGTSSVTILDQQTHEWPDLKAWKFCPNFFDSKFIQPNKHVHYWTEKCSSQNVCSKISLCVQFQALRVLVWQKSWSLIERIGDANRWKLWASLVPLSPACCNTVQVRSLLGKLAVATLAVFCHRKWSSIL